MGSIKINKKKLGSRIKSIRLSKGLHQGEFGALFKPEADKSIVSRWEKGISVPSAERLKVISDIANISTDELIYGSLEETLRELLEEAEKFYRESKKNKEEIIAESITNQEILFRNTLLNTISSFKHNSYFNTKRPECFKKKREHWNERDFQEANSYYMLEELKGTNAILDMALEDAISKKVNPTDEIELLKLLAYCSELLFNDETYTNKGLINFVYNNISELFEQKLPNFTENPNTNTEKGISILRKELDQNLVDEFYKLYDEINKRIEYLEKEYE